jgi:hypothetical protein
VDKFVPRATLTLTPTSADSVSSPMPVDLPFNVYRDHLKATSLLASLGLPLWNPDPPRNYPNLTEKIYNNVSIGDVGYSQEGTFIRMFNVMLPWDHPSNIMLGHPEPYEPLDCGPFSNTLGDSIGRREHHSRSVSAETNASNMQGRTPDE